MMHNSDDNDNSDLKSAVSELTRVQITPMLLTQLSSVKIKINGVEMMARALGYRVAHSGIELNERAAQHTLRISNPIDQG